MSSGEASVCAADFRRALALIQHGERGDEAGMRAIIDDEVVPADRLPQLIRAPPPHTNQTRKLPLALRPITYGISLRYMI